MTQSHQFLLPNSFIFDPISNSSSLSIRCPYLHLNRFHSRNLTITCARSSNKGLFGSQRSRKTLIRLVNFAASNLHYVLPLPEPLNSVIREFGSGSGSGGSGGSWKGFGSSGFDGFGGRKRKVNKKSLVWFWGFAAVCCLGFWGLILGGELELKNDVVLGALCLSMFLVLMRNGCVPEWVLGFGSGAAVVGVSVWKKDEVKRLVKGFKGMGVLRRRQRGRRAI